MRRTTSILRYVLLALVILLLGLLLWWYFFLGAKQDSLATIDAGRGAGITPPSFGDTVGSTYGNIVSSIPSVASNTNTNESVEGSALPRLWQVTKTPVAGANFIPLGASSTLRFVERGTGYVLEADPEKGVLRRITNTLIPRVYEALVGVNGSIILRSIDESENIITSAGQITSTSTSTTTAPKALAVRQLQQNIRTIALHPSGEEILYLEQRSNEKSSVIRAAWNGTGVRSIGELGIEGWQIHWLSDNRMIFVQNAGGGPNYAYEFMENKTLSSLATAALGLSVLPRTNSPTLLYSNLAGGLVLSVRVDTKTDPLTLSIRTSADKCVWAPEKVLIVYCAVPQTLPSADFLDAHLKGEGHTADTWWRVDVRTGRTEILSTENMPQIDVENPVMDPEGNYIAFMNARDKSLWLLRVQE